MKNYKLAITALTLLLAATTTWANPASQPAACPHASAIKSLGFSKVYQDRTTQNYGFIQTNHYDTNDNWNFVVNTIPASSEAEAKNLALAALASLADPANPVPSPFFDKWICVYTINQYQAFAITPTIF